MSMKINKKKMICCCKNDCFYLKKKNNKPIYIFVDLRKFKVVSNAKNLEEETINALNREAPTPE